MNKEQVIELFDDLYFDFRLELNIIDETTIEFSGIFFLPNLLKYIYDVLYSWDLVFIRSDECCEKETWRLIKK
ncbi:hypothetical protein [Flavobacterium sp.]|uniref:hypothetical protein n=1 Tax=Flavobacterium sp. TaxID=239 RepID=UPI00263684FC|nr:hypothetical protein [Flavobacterium sp.]